AGMKPSLAAVAFVMGLCASQLDAATNHFRAPGTQRMAQRLEQITRASNPMNNPYRSAERAEMLRSALPLQSDPIKQMQMRGQFATELLQAGRNREAIEQFNLFRKGLEEQGFWEQNKTSFRFLL